METDQVLSLSREFVAVEVRERERVNVLRAMAISGACKRTIYNWIATGKVESVETPYGRMVYLDSLRKRMRTRGREL